MLLVPGDIGSHQYVVAEEFPPYNPCSMDLTRSTDPQQSRILYHWDCGDAATMLGSGPLGMHRMFTDDEA